MAEALESLTTIDLNAEELKRIFGVSDPGIIYLLELLSNIKLLASISDVDAEQVALNTINITVNGLAIDGNSTSITNLSIIVGGNVTDISDLTLVVGTNTTDIGTNAGNLTTHEALTTAHGVTGDNVGTLDFCTTIVGGVVLLSTLIADAAVTAATIATADVGSAPATYDQTYTNSQTDLINECKATINALVTDVTDVTDQQ